MICNEKKSVTVLSFLSLTVYIFGGVVLYLFFIKQRRAVPINILQLYLFMYSRKGKFTLRSLTPSLRVMTHSSTTAAAGGSVPCSTAATENLIKDRPCSHPSHRFLPHAFCEVSPLQMTDWYN